MYLVASIGPATSSKTYQCRAERAEEPLATSNKARHGEENVLEARMIAEPQTRIETP